MIKRSRNRSSATATKPPKSVVNKTRSSVNPPAPDQNLQKLLHELEVHQIELEMQNTELQAARDDAEAAREKYADLYDFAPVSYFALNTAGRIQMVNLTGASLAGADRFTLVGRPFDRLIPPPLRPAFADFLLQVFAKPEKHSIESEFEVANDLPKCVNIEAQSGPEAHQCRVVVVDITARKRADEILRQNETIVSTLVEHAPVGVYVVDSSLRLHQVNRIAQPLLGTVTPNSGRKLVDVLNGIWSKRVSNEIVAQFRHTLATGEPHEVSDFRARRRDTGAIESYEWQIQRLALHGGEYGVVAFFNNITSRKETESAQRRLEILTATNSHFSQEIEERKAVEASLRIAKKEQVKLLRQSARQQERLRELSRSLLHIQEEERQRISRELHDVVVQSLVGISYQLAAIGQDPAMDAEKLKRKIARAQELVSSSNEIVHSFARDLRPTLLDDLGLLPALQTHLQRFMEDTGVRASLHVGKSTPTIEGEARTTIYRVTQEALSNVARHARASHVTLSIHNKGRAIRLEINDDGLGFNTETKSRAKTAGRLGLLGMRERVEMIGGTFSIESKPGSGTTIIAKLPIKPRRPRTPF